MGVESQMSENNSLWVKERLIATFLGGLEMMDCDGGGGGGGKEERRRRRRKRAVEAERW